MRYFTELRPVTEWSVMLTTVILYFVLIFGLKKWMEKRAAFELGGVMKIYNFFQVLLCLYVGVGFLSANFSFSNPFGLNTEFQPALEWYIFVHYMSKYLDLLDTVFIVLKKNNRQLSFLHLYHHSSILLIWGFLLQVGQANGTCYFGANINSWIHVLMYSHYLVVSFKIRNPLKPYLTLAQIGQMYLCLFHAFLAVYFENVIDANLGKLQAAYHVSMIVLFTHFYRTTYKKEGAEGDKRVKKGE